MGNARELAPATYYQRKKVGIPTTFDLLIFGISSVVAPLFNLLTTLI